MTCTECDTKPETITHLAFKPGLGHHHSGPQPITVTPHWLE